jgi:hypothetical protein
MKPTRDFVIEAWEAMERIHKNLRDYQDRTGSHGAELTNIYNDTELFIQEANCEVYHDYKPEEIYEAECDPDMEEEDLPIQRGDSRDNTKGYGNPNEDYK